MFNKNKLQKINILLLIIFVFSGCSNNSKESELELDKLNEADIKIEQNISEELKINKIITINNIDFNLDSKFEIELLGKLDKHELSILRNSIYAKYGYKFNNPEYRDYFEKFEWYKEKKSNTDIKLNNIDRKNINSIKTIEEKYSINLKSSRDIKNISGHHNFCGEQMKISVCALETINGDNNPIKITMEIKDAKMDFESRWNDGITVSIVDFDKDDGSEDLLIIETGTDIGCGSYIYKYVDNKFMLKSKIFHIGDEFFYDEKGLIYYSSQDDAELYIGTYYNYRKNKIGKITDGDLKRKLNKDNN